jgi:tRNA(adenine34) deaminase
LTTDQVVGGSNPLGRSNISETRFLRENGFLVIICSMSFDEYFMREALKEAQIAFEEDEVPIGAVIVKDGEILAKAHNLREQLNDPTAHAELIAIRLAAVRLNSWRLLDTTIYVTVEPCPMCAGAIVLARVKRLVFGATDPKAGAAGTLMNLLNDARLNHQVEITGGVLAEESRELLRTFFLQRRN